MPSPVERPFKALDAAGADVVRTADEKAPYAAFVWKTVADQFAGRITMFRVYQGSLKSDTTVQNATQGAPERLGHLVQLQGKTQTTVPEIKAGDLGAVAKLKDTRTNDTIADKAAGITFAPLTLPGSRCSPTPSSRRAAATKTRSARRCTASKRKIRRSATHAIRRRTSCCSPARGSCTSRSRSRS